MTVLPTLWFCAIALLWIGYLLLEGFDLGVGMHMLLSARTPAQRRLMLNTIGPLWDGNEVWLVTAIAATFAAFPTWYASLLSALYLPLIAVLLALIARAIGIEYRGKGASERWVRFWEGAIGVGSLVIAFGIGVLLAATTTGLPLDSNGDRVGGAFAWLTWPALLGGVAVVGFCLLHGAAFLGLKTDGPVRLHLSSVLRQCSALGLLPLLAWVVLVQSTQGDPVTWLIALLALLCGIFTVISARGHHEVRVFAGTAIFLVLSIGSIFAAQFPLLLPSTLDHVNDLTIANSANSPYTLGVMTVVAAIGLPLVLLYQGWSYWVFRARLTEQQLPPAHLIRPAIRDAARPDSVPFAAHE